jgi:hypothetical protein
MMSSQPFQVGIVLDGLNSLHVGEDVGVGDGSLECS